MNYLSAREIARIYGWTLTTTYKLAAEGNWRRMRVHGRIRYAVEDADTTYWRSRI